MEVKVDWIMLAGVIGIWLLVIVFAKLLTNLSRGVKAQQEIIKSFESQSEYFYKIHETVRKLYDPKEIENVVNVRVEKAEKEIKSKSGEAIKFLLEELLTGEYRLMMIFVGLSTIYLSDSQIEEVLKILPEQKGKESVVKYVEQMRAEVLKARGNALAKALVNYSPKKGNP